MEPVANPSPTNPDPNVVVPSEVEELRAFKTSRSGTLSRRKSIEEEAKAEPLPPADTAILRSIRSVTGSAAWKWVSSYVKALKIKTLPLPKLGPSRSIYSIENKVKIALAGDWGAGTGPARRVAAGMAVHQPNLTIHLGDVYYSGTPDEYDKIFLGPMGQWPEGTGSGDAPRVLALNGNHEMYSGGQGYFGRLVGQGKRYGQETSYFCVQNQFWRIVALDTGYKTPGWIFGDLFLDFAFKSSNTIPDENLAWLRDEVLKDPNDPRPVILLSHHQPIDAYGRSYNRLRRQIAPFLDSVAVWFWGHEHQLTLLAAAQVEGGKVLRGRCVGHGGKPVEPREKPKTKYPPVISDTRTRNVQDGDDVIKIGYCGYVVLSFEGDQVAIEYYEEPPEASVGAPVGMGDLLVREVLTRNGPGRVSGRLDHLSKLEATRPENLY